MKKFFTWISLGLLFGLLSACGSSRDAGDATTSTDLGIDPT